MIMGSVSCRIKVQTRAKILCRGQHFFNAKCTYNKKIPKASKPLVSLMRPRGLEPTGYSPAGLSIGCIHVISFIYLYPLHTFTRFYYFISHLEDLKFPNTSPLGNPPKNNHYYNIEQSY